MTDELARLRENAAHCRRLAKIVSDERIVTELARVAEEFDAEAEKLEAALRLKDNHQPPKSQ